MLTMCRKSFALLLFSTASCVGQIGPVLSGLSAAPPETICPGSISEVYARLGNKEQMWEDGIDPGPSWLTYPSARIGLGFGNLVKARVDRGGGFETINVTTYEKQTSITEERHRIESEYPSVNCFIVSTTSTGGDERTSATNSGFNEDNVTPSGEGNEVCEWWAPANSENDLVRFSIRDEKNLFYPFGNSDYNLVIDCEYRRAL